jgi:hypothetical protein
MASKEDPERARRRGLVARMRAAPRYLSIPLGVGLVLGGTILSPLPVFGVWMVPVGLAILAPHSPGADRWSRRFYWQKLRALRWAIRNGFVRVKRTSRPADRGAGDGGGADSAAGR